jgi:hypothetical protein
VLTHLDICSRSIIPCARSVEDLAQNNSLTGIGIVGERHLSYSTRSLRPRIEFYAFSPDKYRSLIRKPERLPPPAGR